MIKVVSALVKREVLEKKLVQKKL